MLAAGALFCYKHSMADIVLAEELERRRAEKAKRLFREQSPVIWLSLDDLPAVDERFNLQKYLDESTNDNP